ncbi:MAG TPA: TatD family hydrolase [Longimicrobiales bacterium]|nr:TatD family hydrolase [Longimicrobiales bacterium]
MPLFDSHCHLTDEKFKDDLDAVLENAKTAGVERMVSIASHPDDAEAALTIAERHDHIWTTVGIHPHSVAEHGAAAISRVADIADNEKVVALGETGLDYYYDNSPRPLQRKALRKHVELAADLVLPLVIHCREADSDMISLLREIEGEIFGVLHCFDGTTALLDAGIEAGWMISFSGLVTFKNYDGEGHVRAVPPDQIMIETDSPYLAPIPNRGQRNEPAFVKHTAEAIGRMRGEPFDEVAALTFRNASRFYGLPEK